MSTCAFTSSDRPPPAPLRTPENPAATDAGLNYSYYEAAGSFDQLPDFTTLTPVVTSVTRNFDVASLRRRNRLNATQAGERGGSGGGRRAPPDDLPADLGLPVAVEDVEPEAVTEPARLQRRQRRRTRATPRSTASSKLLFDRAVISVTLPTLLMFNLLPECSDDFKNAPCKMRAQSRHVPGSSYTCTVKRSMNARAALLAASLSFRTIEPLDLLRYLRLPAIHHIIRRESDRRDAARHCKGACRAPRHGWRRSVARRG